MLPYYSLYSSSGIQIGLLSKVSARKVVVVHVVRLEVFSSIFIRGSYFSRAATRAFASLISAWLMLV